MKCLNCGKEVENKYCNVACENTYRGKLMKIKYNENPKLCKYCQTPIPYEMRRNEFCSKECIYKSRYITAKFKFDSFTDDQFTQLFNESASLTDFYNKLGYASGLTVTTRKKLHQRLSNLGLKLNTLKNRIDPSTLTKKELFESRSNWQSARTEFRRHAEKVFNSIYPERKCVVCGYLKHVEIAHIKAVSEFSDDATLIEINVLTNLVGLCPNHHWEFDHECMSKEDKEKIYKSIVNQ